MRYEVDYFDPENGTSSPIDIIECESEYTAEQYVADCEKNADEEWRQMLKSGSISLVEIVE